MPALPNVPQVIRLDFEWIRGADGFAKDRFFVQYAGTAPTAAQLDTFCASIVALCTTNMTGLYDVETSLQTITATDLTSPTGAVGTATSGIVGTRAGGVLIASAAFLTSLEISRRYRGGHPRIYWPWGTQGDLTDEQDWTTALMDQVTTDFGAIIAGIKLLTWTGATIANIVNVSFYEGFHTFTGPTGRVRNIPTVRVAPIVDIVTGFIARKGVASIRKRLLSLA